MSANLFILRKTASIPIIFVLHLFFWQTNSRIVHDSTIYHFFCVSYSLPENEQILLKGTDCTRGSKGSMVPQAIDTLNVNS